MAPQTISAEKRYRLSLLLDAYGELLTERQRSFLRRYFEGDLSLGEIAREHGVSRQAVFDAIKHGEAQLNRYESVLGLATRRMREIEAEAGDRGSRPTAARRSAGTSVGGGGSAGCAARLRRLAEQIVLSSVDSDVSWIARELEAVARELERAGDGTPAGASASARSIRAGRPPVLSAEGPEVD